MSTHTPFFDRAAQLSQLSARFFVPGHKGNPAALPPFGPLLAYDLTEIEGAGDLSCPSGPLAESEANMAKAFGSGASLYSPAGTTPCIQAMLHLFWKPGQPLLLARGCHVAALRALVFLGAQPVWLPLTQHRLAPGTLAAALEKHPGAPVYLTSPDYHGRMADIPALAALCRAAGSPLLVDNAHGAHLRFFPDGRHPLQQGAAACADSAHKTLPCLTGASLLHVQDPALAPRARQLLNLYCSTSPSYLVLESLDLCAGQLLQAPPPFQAAAAALARVAAAAPHLAFLCDDPLRLRLRPAQGGWPYESLLEGLRAAGILPEYGDGETLVLMAGPYNRPEDFAALEAALAAFPPKEPLPLPVEEALPLPKAVCNPREAFLAQHIRLPVKEATGRVMAGLHAPCPPGVPVVVPGERIGPAQARQLAAGGILEVDVLK